MSSLRKLEVNPRRLEVALAAQGATKLEIARKLGLRRADLWRRVVGRTRWRLPEIVLLADVLDVDMGWLVESGSSVGNLSGYRAAPLEASE